MKPSRRLFKSRAPAPAPPPPLPHRHMRTRLQHTFFFVILALTTLAFVWLVADFLLPAFWAIVLATLFHGVFEWYCDRTGGRRSLASVLTLLTIVLLVIIPLALVGWAVVDESMEIYERFASGEIDLQVMVERAEALLLPVQEFAGRFGLRVGVDTESLQQLQEGAGTAALAVGQRLGTGALSVGQNALRITALVFIMLYVLFFFIRDGEKMLDALIRVLPLGDARERRLLGKFAQVTRATIKGTLVVAIVQGGLGGLLFAALGIGAAVFWGVVMTVLSLLPAIGSALVWVPAAIYLLATGSIFKGLILIAAGTLVIGLVDNVLRPLLVGRDTQMPDFLILLSTLGGLTVFGLSGFVIGPIIAAFFLVIWQMFAEEYTRPGEAEAVEAAIEDPDAIPSPAEVVQDPTSDVPAPAERVEE